MADGSTTQLDLMTSQFRGMGADQPKVVKWELTRPETWQLEEWPIIINDSFVNWNYSPESLSARTEWLENDGKLFPHAVEAIAVLEAARATVDDEAGSCKLTNAVLEWFQSKEPALLPGAISNSNTLLAVYQKGGLLHDSAQVLLTLCRDSL